MINTLLLLGIFAILFYKEIWPLFSSYVQKQKDNWEKRNIRKARKELDYHFEILKTKYEFHHMWTLKSDFNHEFAKHFYPIKERIEKKYNVKFKHWIE